MNKDSTFTADEISDYSIKENIYFITKKALELQYAGKLQKVPDAKLMSTVIYLAEQFEAEIGDKVQGDPYKAIAAFAEQALIAEFGSQTTPAN